MGHGFTKERSFVSLLLLGGAWLLGGLAVPVHGSTAPVEEVDQLIEAIDVISNELIMRRSDEFAWETDPPPKTAERHIGGKTALVLLALLEIGHSMQEPGLDSAFEKLLLTEMNSSYALACRIMLLSRLSERYRSFLQRDTARMVAGFSPKVNGWGYSLSSSDDRFDNSTTQFAALALRDAADAGIRIPPDLWKRLELRFIASQASDGGWDYGKGENSKGSMTAAAVATLAVIRRQLYRNNYDKGASDEVARLEASLDAGMKWLDIHFNPSSNYGRNPPWSFYPYYLVAIERAAHATGRIRFGPHEWFSESATFLINSFCTRSAQGKLSVHSNKTTSDLALGLLFLQKGVVANALADVGGDPMLHRPLAVKELTAQLGSRLEMRLSWVDLENTTSRGEAPRVLFVDLFANPGLLEDPESPKWISLRNTLRSGSTALICLPGALGSARKVADSLVEMMPGTRARLIERGDPLLTEPWPVRSTPPAFEVTNGVRTLAVVVAGDPARGLQRGGRNAVRHVDLLTNVWLRAHGGEPPTPRSAPPEPGPRTIQLDTAIAHLVPKGRSIPEPHALQACIARRRTAKQPMFKAASGVLGEVSPEENWALVILSGTEGWNPTQEEWIAIDAILDEGIPVLVETTGGTGNFSVQFAEAATLHYGSSLEEIADFEATLGDDGVDAIGFESVGWTPAALKLLGPGTHPHRLERVVLDGEKLLVVARFDITHALLGRPFSGIHGWQTPWADALLERFLARSSS